MEEANGEPYPTSSIRSQKQKTQNSEEEEEDEAASAKLEREELLDPF